MVSLTTVKARARGWLSRRPWLLQAVYHGLGKPYVEIAILREIIRQGDTIFDVGANTGQYTCLFGYIVGPNGAVHAFEPLPPTFCELQRNVTRHAAGCRIFLNQCALGDSDGVMRMYVPRGAFTEAAMTAHSTGSWERRGRVSPIVDSYDRCPVTTMDKYAANNRVGEIALIKCDVEGAELLVLRGAVSVLSAERPPMLLLEIWPPWCADFGYEPRDLFEFLREKAGYRFYHIGQRGLRVVSTHEDPFPGIFPDYLNFLCIVPSVHGDRVNNVLGTGADPGWRT